MTVINTADGYHVTITRIGWCEGYQVMFTSPRGSGWSYPYPFFLVALLAAWVGIWDDRLEARRPARDGK